MVYLSLLVIAPMLCAQTPQGVPVVPPSNSILGTWNAKFTPETYDICAKFGFPIPKATLFFGTDLKFTYTMNPAGKETRVAGSFTLSETGATLAAEPLMDGWPLRAKFEDSKLSFDGMTFVLDQTSSLVGIWVRTTDKGQDPTIRFSFGKDGTYASRNQGGTTKGRFTVEGRTVTLFYMEVDDVPVEPGMKLTISLSEDGLSFQIGTTRYVRIIGSLPP